MKSAPRFLSLVSGLTLLAITVSLAVSFTITLLMPAPDSAPMSLRAALTLLRDPASDPVAGLRLHRSCSLDDGPRAGPIATAAAAEMNLPGDRVRAVWESRGVSGTGSIQVVTSPLRPSADTDSNHTVDELVRQVLLAPGMDLPPFSLSVRENDGCWKTVGPSDLSMQTWRMRILFAFVLSALLIVPMAWWIARRFSLPLDALAKTAERASLDDPRMPALANDTHGLRVYEVEVAAAAMEAMRSRLLAQSEDATRMLAAVAHDLRTPLTALRVRAETVPPDQRKRMVADIARMDLMIGQVLDYARGQSQSEARILVNLADMVRECVAEQQAIGGDVQTMTLANIVLRVEALGLRRAFVNLINNAVRYGSDARVSLHHEDNVAVFRVEDAGPGIPADQIERLQKPFQRLESSRNQETGGIGLGLAVARAAAIRHGGCLWVTNRSAGGLCAEIQLPIASGE